MPIGRSKTDRKKMAVRKDGKEAITHIKVIKRYDKYTLISVKIDTGRTHQIRVHMAEIGYPVVVMRYTQMERMNLMCMDKCYIALL